MEHSDTAQIYVDNSRGSKSVLASKIATHLEPQTSLPQTAPPQTSLPQINSVKATSTFQTNNNNGNVPNTTFVFSDCFKFLNGPDFLSI